MGEETEDLPQAQEPRAAAHPADDGRLRALVGRWFQFAWRSLRGLGVQEADLDDAAQQVFIVVARKLGHIDPTSEQAFVFSTALRVASHERRAWRRRREVGDEAMGEPSDASPGPDELADQRRARELLADLLDEMPEELRAVFVLFEIEEMPTPAIATLLGIPLGTAASRLRRARELFHKLAAQVAQPRRPKEPSHG